MKFFKRSVKPAPAPAPALMGITEADWRRIRKALETERAMAEARQKKPDAAPSRYMNGIDFAITLVDSIHPYNILKEEQ